MTALAAAAFVAASAAAQAAVLPSVGSGDLFIHLDAGQGVATSGSEVLSWTDQSLNGFVFDQAAHNVGGNAPQLAGGVIGGKPVIRFDGSDDVLTSTGNIQLFPTNSSGLTVFTVFQTNNNEGQKFLLNHGNTGSNTFELGYDTGSGSGSGNFGLHRGSSNATVAPSGTILNNQYARLSTVVRTSGSVPKNISIFKDGSTVPVSNNVNGWLSAGSYRTDSTRLDVAARNDTQNNNWGSYHNGDIAEVLMYRGQLSDLDRNRVENYLGAKYFGKQQWQNIVTDTFGNGDLGTNPGRGTGFTDYSQSGAWVNETGGQARLHPTTGWSIPSMASHDNFDFYNPDGAVVEWRLQMAGSNANQQIVDLGIWSKDTFGGGDQPLWRQYTSGSQNVPAIVVEVRPNSGVSYGYLKVQSPDGLPGYNSADTYLAQFNILDWSGVNNGMEDELIVTLFVDEEGYTLSFNKEIQRTAHDGTYSTYSVSGDWGYFGNPSFFDPSDWTGGGYIAVSSQTTGSSIEDILINSIVLDAFVVPEPTSLALLLLGGLGLLLRGARKRGRY